MSKTVKFRRDRNNASYDLRTLALLFRAVCRQYPKRDKVLVYVNHHRKHLSLPEIQVRFEEKTLEIAYSIKKLVKTSICRQTIVNWNRSTPLLKSTHCLAAQHTYDLPVLKFDVRLGDTAIRKAHAYKKGFSRYFSDKINWRFKQLGCEQIKFWFIVEYHAVSGDKEHLHGAMVCSDIDRDKVYSTLKLLSGKDYIENHKARVEHITKTPDNVAIYACKSIDYTKRVIDNKVFYASPELKQRGKIIYQMRSSLFYALQIIMSPYA
jgi:hypothetical protein